MKQLLANFLDAEESIVDLSASQDLCEFREVAAVGLSTEVERFYGTPPGETDRNRNWEDHVNFLRSPISGGESEDEILLGKISILEAGIGAGKTTLGMLMTLLACSKGKKAIFIEEPSNDRKLQKFLENMQKKALKFQKRMLGYRVQILRLALELTKRGYNVLLDRSLYGDRVFEHVNVVQGNITPEQHAEYLEYFLEMRRLYEDICRAATVFYFPQTLEETKARIKKRNRTGEVGGYTDEYLNQINDTYANYREVMSRQEFTRAVYREDRVTSGSSPGAEDRSFRPAEGEGGEEFSWRLVTMRNHIVDYLWNQEKPDLTLSEALADAGHCEHVVDLDDIGGKVKIHCSWNAGEEFVGGVAKKDGVLVNSFCETVARSLKEDVWETYRGPQQMWKVSVFG